MVSKGYGSNLSVNIGRRASFGLGFWIAILEP